MYYKLIRNDISRSKAITLTTMLFIAAASMLVSLAAILIVNLTGAIDTLMMRAKTPHFMQMHSGPIDTDRLATFAQRNKNVEGHQVLKFLNVDGSQIVFERGSLADNVQDNGLSVQSKKFDFLLDLDGDVIDVKDGELYVPICYLRDNTAKVGDRVTICGNKLIVAGFLRDSQMNSTLSSSKRFLVSKNDYLKIERFGNIEYLIEFRLKDVSSLGAFETAYTSAKLEANGPTITYPLFKMLNAISDGLMIAVILLISVLVVMIAFMCIRFTLLAKIEDDYREIGVMKAIGIRIWDIKKIYLAKYAAIAIAGCILGYALSLLSKDLLLENIRLYMGESGNSAISSLLGVVGILLVFLTIILYVNVVLKRFRKISATEAIRFGVSQEHSGGAKRLHLSENKLLSTDVFLGIKDVLARKNLYSTMLAVLVLSTFIIIVPHNIYNTISSKDFVKYMGIGNCDMRFDIQQTDRIPAKAQKISTALGNDSAISKYVILTTKSFRVKMEDGSVESIKVELGDHSVFPLEYTKGRAPATENEISLSTTNADELGKEVGDAITLVDGDKERNLKVCGLYSDITNGGKTAKGVFTDDSANIMWSVICTKLTDSSLVGEKVMEYKNRYEYAKVTGIDEYVSKTFGSTKNSIAQASRAAVAVALTITLLVILLFTKMLVAKDKYSIAIMKAIGFTTSDITSQYISRAVFVLLVGIVLGTILANTLGEVLAGMIISQLGASSLQFTINPISTYLLYPLLMAFVALAATIVGTTDTRQIKISENIKE